MDRLPTETVKLLDQLCSRPGTSEINVHHFLKIFINNRDGLMQFLERYVKTAGKSIKVAGVVDALLELVLYEASRLENDSDGTAKSTVYSSSREHLLKLALSLLRDDQLLYDSKKALLICHQRGFFDGCVYLWEKERLYDQLLKHYMNLDDTTNVLLTCTRFGAEMPDLWLLALRYFASKPDCADALHQVVSEVDQRNLISPMAVLQILSDTDAEHSCQLGTVRDYLLRHLEAGTTQIAAMHHQVQQLRDETMHNREVVRALTSQIKIFQQQKCALCHQSLEPPSVHFLCDHSYHKLCFENYAYADQQCPECAPRNKKLLADTTIDTSCSSSTHVADQLRVALHTDHPSCENSTSDVGWNGSSASTSSTPQLPKILASRVAQGSFGPSVGQPRPQSPLTLSTNAIQMSVLQPSRKTDPIKTQEPSILQRPVPISNVTEACAPVRRTSSNLPTSSFEPIKSTSSGYYSVETAELQSVAESTVKPGTNPFGDSDTENDIETEIGSTTDHPRNLRPPTDADLGQSRVSLNPFDV
ncbi:hypothetical protein PHET_06785 [Paragonimus heterotremus]|uniref:RING-type domain-containing protein n=1 Tax=Paragonimus heterotremus TaxID=100268 RepID=A0A8J4T6H6_9TREM|nr:hypothetical protein PHET_06785 [Paragonimus heterotremus]